MRFHKSVITYILWALYGLTVCAVLTLQLDAFCFQLGIQSAVAPLLAAGGCILLLFLILYLPLRCVAAKTGKRKTGARMQRRGPAIWEYPFVLLLELTAAFIRLWEGGRAGAGSAADIGISVGTIEAEPALLLDLIALLLLYCAVRLILGKVGAAAASVAYVLLPILTETVAEAMTVFFFLAGTLLFLLIALLLYLLAKAHAAIWPMALFTGLIMGAAVFLDAAFLCMPLLVLAGIFEAEEAGTGKRKAVAACWLLLAGAAIYFILLFGYAYLHETSVSEYLAAWASCFMPHAAVWDREQLWRLFPVSCMCVLYVFGFFEDEQGTGSIWFLPFLFLICLNVLSGGSAGSRSLGVLFWLILGGSGLYSACCAKRPQRQGRRMQRKRGQAAGRPETDEKKTKRMREKKPPQPLDTAASQEEADILPGAPLPTPLPMPKRRAHKPIDYAFEPGEHEMCYDIEQIDEGDDFDLS